MCGLRSEEEQGSTIEVDIGVRLQEETVDSPGTVSASAAAAEPRPAENEVLVVSRAEGCFERFWRFWTLCWRGRGCWVQSSMFDKGCGNDSSSKIYIYIQRERDRETGRDGGREGGGGGGRGGGRESEALQGWHRLGQ